MVLKGSKSAIKERLFIYSQLKNTSLVIRKYFTPKHKLSLIYLQSHAKHIEECQMFRIYGI